MVFFKKKLRNGLFEYHGNRFWYKDGELHREDGPAIEGADGIKAWYLDGKEYSKVEFDKQIKKLKAAPCHNKIVEIDGIKYKLTVVE